jgi:DNA-binding response OmpR family regulator
MQILVIDDDPGVRLLCRIPFRADGDEVIEVASGREGLEILDSDGADAVVLDVMLPNINGLDPAPDPRG